MEDELKTGALTSILLITSLILGSMVFIAGCLEDEDDKLDLIVVTIAPQKELVEMIAGDYIEVVLMVPENMDPHIYSPTTGQLLKVSDADIYFELGSGIEFEEINMDTIKETNSRMKVVDMSEGVEVVSFEDHGVHDEEDHEKEEHEHDHMGTDPHIWLDPKNMKRMADNVLEALVQEDPENEEEYTANHQEYVEAIDDLIGDIDDLLSPFANRSFLSYHPAWGYFADAFDLVQLAVEDEGKDPGPQGLAKFIQQAKDENITVVFVEPQFDTSSALQIASEINGVVVKADPLAMDYMDNLMDTANKIAQGLS